MKQPGKSSGLGYAVATGVLVAAVSILALRAGRLPEAVPRSAPASSFSAERAMDHVRVLAQAPRPVGTAAHTAASDYLLSQLGAMGLETRVQETTWVRNWAARGQTAARVRNILARLPGRGGGATLLLMAHYDSQPQTWGAGDDAAGVATILEALRALAADGPMDNEIIVALTDAEEVGLIGAEAFAALDPWFERVDRTLNFEGRGQSGAALMFETAAGGLEGVRDFSRHAPWPAASSISYEVYRRMPNDTDFSVVRRSGGHGLNFAFIGSLPAYHSRLDTAQRLDPSTLQHMGANALALARHYGAGELPAPAEAEGVYFNPWGLRPLWVYGAASARATAVAALLLAFWVALTLRSRGELLLKRLVLGWGLVAVGGGVAMALTWVAWGLLGRGGPTPYDIPYAGGVAALALILVAIAGWLYCLGLWGGTAWELLASLSLFWGLLGVASAWLLLGASHLFVWPTLLAALGLALGHRLGSPWWTVILGLLPSLLLWVPALRLGYLALTVRSAVVLALPSLLAATLLTPVAAWLGNRRRIAAATLALASGLGLLGWAIHARSPNVDRPLVNSLFVLHDRESGETSWNTLDAEVDAWTSLALGAQPDRRVLPLALDSKQREVLSATAALAQPADTLTVVRERDERPAGGRSVAVRLASHAAANLRLWVHAEVALTSVSIDGRPCELDDSGELRISLHGLAPEGFLLEAEMGDRWPLYLEVVEVTYGLPADLSERPSDTIPRPGWWTDTTMVKTGFTL